MSPHQIIAVAVRLFVIWLIINSVMVAPIFYVQLQMEFSMIASLSILLVVGILVLVVIWLGWRFPLTIANKLLDPQAQEPAEPAEPASADLWLAVGCAFIGLWLLSTHVPSLVQMLTLWQLDYDGFTVNLVYDLTGLALGVWLILGAKGFRRIFWWARNAGYRQPPD